jgi:uncharacterized protein (DUF488 family)
MTSPVYTIGHSTHSIERLIELLQSHSISALCDVRSQPYSRVNPQFNRETLKEALRNADIKYVFLGKELGARSEDKSCYRNGQVQYDLLAQTKLFEEGIKRVKDGARDYRIALMCAEKEPLDCHRTILVARKLCDEGLTVKHILYDGQIEEHAHAIGRLVGQLRLPGADMFREEEEVISDAYARQGSQIAYREETAPNSSLEEMPQMHTSKAAE